MKLHIKSPAFWSQWDEEQRTSAVRIMGGIVALFAVFTLLSCTSYLFTWKQDMSLLSDPSASAQTANLCGKLGLKWAHFLVAECFGLGSFVMLVLLFAISARLIALRWHRSLLGTAFLTVSWTLLSSFIFALAAKFLSLDFLFGSGPGGQCGRFINNALHDLVGVYVTIGIYILAAALLLTIGSRRFSHWLGSLGRQQDVEEPQEPQEDEQTSGSMQADEAAEQPELQQPLEDMPQTDAAHDEIEQTEEPAIQHHQEEASQQQSTEPEQPQMEASQPAGEMPEQNTDLSDIDRGEELSSVPDKPLEPINVRLDPPEGLPRYRFPDLDMLSDHGAGANEVSREELQRNNLIIRNTLSNYGIKVDDVKAVVGPTVTLYKVTPAPGVRVASIKSRQEDIALSLNAKGVRITTLSDSVGIEVANDRPQTVPLKALLNSDAFRNTQAELPVAIGCTITKKVKVFDLADAPHLLVAGATKQGKSVGLNVLVSSLLYSKHPAELKFVFIDPKMVEFSAYERMHKHYLAVLPTAMDEEDERKSAIVKNPKDAEKILRSLCIEMDQRYQLFSDAYVNNVILYNDKYKKRKLNPEKGHRFMPYLVVIVDEYADLTMSGGSGSDARNQAKSITASIIRLAQKGRAAGIHVVLATQRPSVDVITGLIKANFPARIAFRVTTGTDSKTILDNVGAEKLIGRGDMLYYAGTETERIQCGFVSNDEINEITEFVEGQKGYGREYNTPYYLPDPDPSGSDGEGGMIDMKDLDERFEEAARQVVMSQRGSTSDLQRKLGMGYAKAGRVMDQLEAAGIVGPQDGSKPRMVLVKDLAELETILSAYLGH